MHYTDKEHKTIRDGSRSVPVSLDNRHYQEILKRVKEGELIEPYVAPPKAEYEPTNRELLEELFTTKEINDAKETIKAKK